MIYNNVELFPTLFQQFTGQTGITLYEDESAFHLEAQVPGVKAEEIQMSFENGNLYIEAKPTEEKKDVKYYYKTSRNFSYEIPLPEGIDESQIPDAICKDGILKISFIKTKSIQPRKINVKSA
jgi:HSP20 family protein